jgi:hypothetical protein
MLITTSSGCSLGTSFAHTHTHTHTCRLLLLIGAFSLNYFIKIKYKEFEQNYFQDTVIIENWHYLSYEPSR